MIPEEKTDQVKKAVPKGSTKEPGLRGLNATTLFRITNFELFVKPNKVVMGFGIFAITGCVAYLAYMNAVAENKNQGVYEVYNIDGTKETTRKSSKWD